ncbi:MAG: aspartyl/glutamyl-tRNA amidotransferase subunit C [Methanomassiliicoccaceae archaeon]|nr:aspartyl/glutamyl-tRNA amidotransferase subunit C [Methanomassiliicoccaceae archaeon]
MDRETLKNVAKAAHLAFSDEELDRYGRELEGILGLFDELDGAPEGEGYGVTPTVADGVMRDDVPGIHMDPYGLLRDMMTYEGYVRGPRLL